MTLHRSLASLALLSLTPHPTPCISGQRDMLHLIKPVLDGRMVLIVSMLWMQEKPGFPVNLQGHPGGEIAVDSLTRADRCVADNGNTRYFTGGNHMQRASLNLVNGAIFAGFASHCDFFNYTGWVVGMSTSGEVLTAYATMGGPGSQAQDDTWNGGGGGGGV